MARVVPPWTYTLRDGKAVVVLGGADYLVDPGKPPVFFFVTYLQARLPQGWLDAQAARNESDRHPLWHWLQGFQSFVAAFEARDSPGEYRDFLTGPATGMMILGNDMYSLEGNQKLQESLMRRLTGNGFQGAMHEVSVAATMTRAGFGIEFEDETDSTRKHPEFIATHRRTRTRIAVEAKSIHRTGVLGYKGGSPVPTLETAAAQKIAAQVCRQVKLALPKADGLPLYAFVDLNLPPEVAEQLGEAWIAECTSMLPQVDSGFDENGIVVGRKLNLLAVVNRPMHLGEEKHKGGDLLMGFLSPPAEQCQFSEGTRHVEDVKAAMKSYGTIAQ